MLTEVYSVEVVGGFLSSDRLFLILSLAHALKNLLAIGKLIAFLPTKLREEPKIIPHITLLPSLPSVKLLLLISYFIWLKCYEFGTTGISVD